REGGLIVQVTTEEATSKLLQIQKLNGKPVTVCYAGSDTTNVGKIKDVDLNLSEETIVESLKDYGVINAKRDVKRIIKNNEVVKIIPLTSVTLTFEDRTTVPQTITLGYLRHQVLEVIRPPP